MCVDNKYVATNMLQQICCRNVLPVSAEIDWLVVGDGIRLRRGAIWIPVPVEAKNKNKRLSHNIG